MTTTRRPVPGDTPTPGPPLAPLAPGPDPPEWEPDDQQAQAIAEVFAESAQEGPLFDPWEPTND